MNANAGRNVGRRNAANPCPPPPPLRPGTPPLHGNSLVVQAVKLPHTPSDKLPNSDCNQGATSGSPSATSGTATSGTAVATPRAKGNSVVAAPGAAGVTHGLTRILSKVLDKNCLLNQCHFN